MDIVYSVRPGDSNEELRYSLRSLALFPHNKVYIVGYTPKWVTNVISIRGNFLENEPYKNTTNNLILACKNREISADFVYMNDDFFFLKHLKQIPTYHAGPIRAVITRYESKRKTRYYKGLKQTLKLLEKLQIPTTLCYETHTPMVFNKQKFLELIKLQQQTYPGLETLHKRSLYGNFYDIKGIRIKDPKIATYHYHDLEWIHKGCFVSTQDRSFEGYVGDYIRNLFPTPSIYET